VVVMASLQIQVLVSIAASILLLVEEAGSPILCVPCWWCCLSTFSTTTTTVSAAAVGSPLAVMLAAGHIGCDIGIAATFGIAMEHAGWAISGRDKRYDQIFLDKAKTDFNLYCCFLSCLRAAQW